MAAPAGPAASPVRGRGVIAGLGQVDLVAGPERVLALAAHRASVSYGEAIRDGRRDAVLLLLPPSDHLPGLVLVGV